MRPHLLKRIGTLAEKDPDVLFLTGDVGYGFTDSLREQLGPKFINAGVAEANMISIAAGLGAAGFKPFIYSIIPFVTLRCLEQIRNGLAYHRVPARILGMGAGFTYGSQGPSHHGLEDLHVMAAIPTLSVINCANNEELDFFFNRLSEWQNVVYFRVGKDRGATFHAEEKTGLAYRVRGGKDLNLLASGHLLGEALRATEMLEGQGYSVNLISCPWLQPFPSGEVNDRLVDAPVVSVVEAYAGNGFEQGVGSALLSREKPVRYRAVSVARDFTSLVGDAPYLRRAAGLDSKAIAAAALSILRT